MSQNNESGLKAGMKMNMTTDGWVASKRASAEDKIIELLDTLSDDQKLEVFANYCTECGCKNQHCNCWRDK